MGEGFSSLSLSKRRMDGVSLMGLCHILKDISFEMIVSCPETPNFGKNDTRSVEKLEISRKPTLRV